jgi:hypothetical protein
MQMLKLPFYLSRESAIEVRDLLIELGDLLGQLAQIQNVGRCVNFEGEEYRLCLQLKEEYGVVLTATDPIWNQLSLADQEHLLMEIYAGVRQLAQALYDGLCPDRTNCDYSSPEELFRLVFASRFENGVQFQLLEGPLVNDKGENLGAAMYTLSDGRIQIGSLGRGMPNREDPRITRYLVSHELLHLLSNATGGIQNRESSARFIADLYYSTLAGRLTQIRHPFYTTEQGYTLASDLPQGLNNFGGENIRDLWQRLRVGETLSDEELALLWAGLEETGVELLNLYVWDGVTSGGNELGFADPSDPEVQEDLENLIQEIENQLPTWLAKPE